MAEYRVLGSVEVEHLGEPIPLGRRRERCLLGILVLEAGKAVATERLVDLLWDGVAPDSSVGALRAHVSRLRASLSTVDIRLAYSAEGYTAHVDPDAVDALRFRRLVEDARGIGPAADRAARLREALDLWRGPLLADAASDRLRDRLAAPWNELRLAAIEGAVEADLQLGRNREVIGELSEVVAEHAYREHFTVLLMLALNRSGRRADALETFRALRRRLRDDLGLEPGAELTELHRRILTGDPALIGDPGSTAATSAPPGEPSATPRQLPADTRAFVGRRAELARLWRSAEESGAGHGVGTVVISAIDGMAGVGKTALALHAAHSLVERFPDGQIYVDLRGHARNHSPRSSGEVLAGLLRTLGVPAHQTPTDADERAALYRQRLAGTRTLIVLDDAANEAQVAPLIPGTRGCLVIVTSRVRLTSLDDADLLPLDVLSTREAIALLQGVAGHARVAEADPLAEEIAELCGRLPIALRIAAALLRARPSWGLGYLAERLRDRHSRVDRLRDERRDLTDLFDLSANQLDAPVRRMFALLGLAPGPDIGLYAAASLAAVDFDTAYRLLEDLVDRNLLTAPAPGRYQFHELLRLYAAALAERELAADEREAAVRRVVDFYVHTSYGADRHMGITREELALTAPAAGCLVQTMTGQQQATAWFAQERECLRAAQQLAADHELDTAVWQIAWILHIYHQRQGMAHDHLVSWRSALVAAERLADTGPMMITALRGAGAAHARLGHHSEGVDHLERALALAERVGDLEQQARTHHTLSLLWDRQQDAERVIAHAEQLLRLCRVIGDETNEGNALSALAWYRARAGRFAEAGDFAEAARALFRRNGHRDGEAASLDTLALVAHRTGHSEQALNYYGQALELFRAAGNLFQEAESLEHLGEVYESLGRFAEARQTWCLALASYESQQTTVPVERVRLRLDSLPDIDRPV